MRVLHVYKTSFPTTVGGIEVFIDTLSNQTHDLGVQNTVLSLATVEKTTEVIVNDYKVILAKEDLFIASTGFSLSAFKEYRKQAKLADIIHFHFPNPFGDFLYLFSKKDKPCIVTYHSDIIKQKRLLKIYQPVMNMFLRRMKKIVATSPKYLASSDVLQHHRGKVDIIPIGIIEPKITPKIKQCISEWKSKLPTKFFLFVGELRYYKGLKTAIKSAAESGLPLIIAGKGGDEVELKQYANELGAKNISFLGFISDNDKWALLSLCYCFVMPSHLRSEAFGISLLEAAAMGKPMISCEIGTGTSYVNIDQKTGVVVKPNSVEALTMAMSNIYENEHNTQIFGKAALLRYHQLFSAETQAQKYHKIYCELIKSGI
ncbi:MAG: glycosyltransferase [Lentilitoribacter sp.]